MPESVSVLLDGSTLVITLHGALSAAEQVFARSAEGAARVQEFHRELFQSSCDLLRQEIGRITGTDVREASAEIEPGTGAVVHTFKTGTMVQCFLLSDAAPGTGTRTGKRRSSDGVRNDPPTTQDNDRE
jgi:uncharacterized protein YbcI